MGVLTICQYKTVLRQSKARLTLDAVAFLVTMMMGQMGRYFEIRRADLPLKYVSELISSVSIFHF